MNQKILMFWINVVDWS